jgi:hypothetical protein
MLYHLSIHRPKPEHEADVIASMHRFGDAARGLDGLQEIDTLRDARTGVLVGLAVWTSIDALEAARPLLASATEGDDFESWEQEPFEVFLLEEV